MRETDDAVAPEAIARASRDKKATLTGFVLALGGVVMLVAPVFVVGDLKLIPALAGLALVGLGCVRMDPATFGPIFRDALAKLPWGPKL